eukprot:2532002-Amphidinium_carterae.4
MSSATSDKGNRVAKSHGDSHLLDIDKLRTHQLKGELALPPFPEAQVICGRVRPSPAASPHVSSSDSNQMGDA